MPKQRFYNLPAEKRECILNSAIKEFSSVPVNQVSINKIIKGANISRGSFYQYFEDKNDLICEIISGYKNILVENVKEHLTKKDTDIFSLFIEILEYTVSFIEQSENQQLCFYIFDNMRNDENFFQQIVGHDEMENIVNMIISLIDTSKFRYSSREDIINVLEIISAIGFKTVIKTIKQPNDKFEYIEGFKHQLVIIKNGILIE